MKQSQRPRSWSIILRRSLTKICQPPDPISHVCSLTGKYISKKHFTYHPVQLFKIIFRKFLFSRIWSSTQDRALLVLFLNLVGFFISRRPDWSLRNDSYHSCTRRGNCGGALNIFTSFIGAGRRFACLGWALGLDDHRGEGSEEIISQHFHIWRDKQTIQGLWPKCIWKDRQNQGESLVLEPKTRKPTCTLHKNSSLDFFQTYTSRRVAFLCIFSYMMS